MQLLIPRLWGGGVLCLSVTAPRALGRGDQSMEGCEFVVGLSMARRFEQNRTEQNRLSHSV